MKIEFILNEKLREVEVEAGQTLLHLLRDQLGLTGTKCGCDTGDCGVCGVILDGHLVYSCLVPVTELAGRQVTTIEGIQLADGSLSDLQQEFLNHGAVQCGYCIPAMILAGEALLRNNPTPSRDEIRTAISQVLCRCTGYQQIVDAIEETAQRRQRLTAVAVGQLAFD
jgi:aerobic-type carbon monoxide dehydrogenase small subunit (CoxS/CutS family)